jgi:hypothetical protein
MTTFATSLTTTVAVLAGVTAVAPTAGAETPQRGACSGVDPCRVVATADVDGDRRADQVGWVTRRAKEKVVIRVATADGERLRKRLDVSLWFGTGAWGGATHIDGRRGVELLIGTLFGAHTPSYTMLTYRHGDLVVERSPAYGSRWFVDAAYSVYAGWDRDRVEDRVLMRFTVAMRSADDSFDGSTTTYRWRHGSWKQVRERDRHWASARRAAPVAGWHVHGLERFPG